MRRSLVRGMTALLLASIVVASVSYAAGPFPTDNLWVPTGIYQAQPGSLGTIFYPNGVFIGLLTLSLPTQSFPPPPPGAPAVHAFGCQASFALSVDGGAHWVACVAPAQMTTMTSFVGTQPSGENDYAEQILGMDISAVSQYGPLMIRESPVLTSAGQTAILGGNGGYEISSFFDVFTELSLDGGMTWMPSTPGSTRLDLMPEPGAIVSLLTGMLGLVVFRRIRK